MKKIIISILTLIIMMFFVLVITINLVDSEYCYTVTWKNYDGNIIYQEDVKIGTLPRYKGNIPSKESDEYADYTFTGWLPEVTLVNEDTSYIAEYDVDIKKFGLVSSHESGFYDTEFNLSLVTTSDATIYYTLDSTTPTTNSNVYNGKIKIKDNSSCQNVYSSIKNISSIDVYTPTELVDKCVIIKAIAVDNSGNVSDMITKSYFVDYQNKNGYDTLPIISMVVDPSDLFDYEKGIYVTGKIYDESEKEGYPETFPANYNQKGKEWEREAEFTYFNLDKSFSFDQSIGIRIHGGWTRAFNQKSFNLYARSEYSGTNTFEKPFFETEKLKTCMLRSGGYRDTHITKIRDGMNQTLSQNEAFMSQDNYPCILFLNGEYWGIYYLQERFTDEYVEEHYGIDKDNVIIVKNGESDEGLEEDILLYNDMINFFSESDLSIASNYQKVLQYIDLDEFASYMATELYIGNMDWPGNNVAMWRSRNIKDNPYEDGKWHFMFYDTDDCADMMPRKNHYDSDPFANSTHWAYGPLDQRCTLGLMLSKLLYNKGFKQLFKETFIRIAQENYSMDNVNKYLDNEIIRLSTPMTAFYDRFVSSNIWSYDEEYFISNVEVIRVFYKNRYEYALKYLNEHLLNY